MFKRFHPEPGKFESRLLTLMSTQTYWDCPSGGCLCGDLSSVFYKIYAANAKMPKDVYSGI